jgi:TPR repeat protein
VKFVYAAVLAASLACAGDFAAALAAYEKGDYATAKKEWQEVAETGNAAAQFNLALLFYDGKGTEPDLEAAFHWFSRAANQGYVRAERNLGAMYAEGRGAVRDNVKAYKWFALCAAEGNEACATQRDMVSKRLKPPKLAEAQRLAKDFKPTKEAAE